MTSSTTCSILSPAIWPLHGAHPAVDLAPLVKRHQQGREDPSSLFNSQAYTGIESAQVYIEKAVAKRTPSVIPLTRMSDLHRRAFLNAATAAAFAATSGKAQTAPIPTVDCHIHLFDQTRPQGAPYSGGRGNTEPALPVRYRKLATPLGIVAAIEIEASPWIEDNLWVLEVEEKDQMMVGAIGNLQPDKPEFKEYLDRYRKNKLFLGIRYGNLWGYNLVNQVGKPTFMDGLKLMQEAGLTMDTANPRPDLIEAILRVNDRLPELRIVFDHLPSLLARLDAATRTSVEGNLREMAKRPTIYIKVSEVMRIVDGKPATDPAVYKPTLDFFFDTFGEDKLIFGSDWPNGPAVDNLPVIVKIVRDYFQTKSRAAAEKYFWKNSVAAYGWIRRDPSQPQ
jgi:predicted TIM-barrel fold metal-dependent hydrolase